MRVECVCACFGGVGYTYVYGSSWHVYYRLITPTYTHVYPQSRIIEQDLFQEFGELESARIIKERGSGRSLGYGFVKVRSMGMYVFVTCVYVYVMTPRTSSLFQY